MKVVRDRFSSLYYGLTLPFAALKLILSKKRLMAWSALPIVLTLALSIWGTGALKIWVTGLGMQWLASRGYAPDSFAVHAALFFLKIVLFVLAAVTFSFIAGIIASPFNDFLAEASEPFTDPPLAPAPGGLRDKIRAFFIDLLKTIVITAIQIILVLIGVVGFWLPGLNLIPFAAAFWLLAFQFISYPQTRRFEGFGEAMRFLGRHLFATLGFGATI
jgi:uncharacterized protein involved in cysteine biosynthesis